MEWQLQDAKNQFSKVVKDAQANGPQVVTVRGERAVIVISAKDYDALIATKPSIVDHLLGGPDLYDAFAEAADRGDQASSREVAL